MAARPLILACLAAALALLGGCASGNDYYGGRSYAYDGPGYYRPYGYPYGSGPGWYGYPSSYPYAYRDRDDRRFVRTDRNVVCDRRTEACYKKGDIDASETRDHFGNDAGRRVDRIRDRQADNDIFLPSRNTVCNQGDRACYRNGDPDRSLTRDVFGRNAARQLGR